MFGLTTKGLLVQNLLLVIDNRTLNFHLIVFCPYEIIGP